MKRWLLVFTVLFGTIGVSSVSAAPNDNIVLGPAGGYDARCGVPIPAGVKVRSLPNPDHCSSPLSAQAKKAMITLPNDYWSAQTQARVNHDPNGYSAFASYSSDTSSGWAIQPTMASPTSGIVGYMAATYPLNITPTDGRAFAVVSSILQPSGPVCNYAEIQRIRQDPNFPPSSQDVILFSDGCVGDRYVWSLADPAVQQLFVLNGGYGKVVAIYISQISISPIGFQSRMYDQVHATWNVVETVYTGTHQTVNTGILAMQGENLDTPTQMCATLATGASTEATKIWKNGGWYTPDATADLSVFQYGSCVTQAHRYSITSTVYDQSFGLYATWAP
jgi:hypothetical protein